MSADCIPAYQRPHLVADQVELVGSHRLQLRWRERRLEMEVDGDASAAVAWLERLRDPNDEAWASAREEAAQLIRDLDHAGWLADCGAAPEDSGGDQLFLERADVWLDELATLCGAGAGALLESAAGDAARLVAQLDGGILASDWPQDGGLAGRALGVQMRCWQRTAPETLRVVSDLFRAAASDGKPSRTLVRPAPWAPISVDLVWQACGLLAVALAEARPRSPRSAEPPAGPAINLLVFAEHEARRLVEELGQESLTEALRGPELALDMAKSVFLHQHALTARFVECILPLMRRRLQPALRTLVYRYFSEELGHEDHERAICLRLGLAESEVDSFLPLPFFGAYVDVLGYAAEIDPLAFMLSLCAAEGLPGTRKPLPDLLSEAGVSGVDLTDHTDIDHALDHGSYSRRLFAQLGPVSAESGARALSRFLDVLEISQRAWHHASTAVLAGLPLHAGPFETEPARLLEAFALPR